MLPRDRSVFPFFMTDLLTCNVTALTLIFDNSYNWKLSRVFKAPLSSAFFPLSVEPNYASIQDCLACVERDRKQHHRLRALQPTFESRQNPAFYPFRHRSEEHVQAHRLGISRLVRRNGRETVRPA